jgi:hypothetical protein
MTLQTARAKILTFSRQCEAAEYTDTNKVWSLLDDIACAIDAVLKVERDLVNKKKAAKKKKE